MKIYLQFLFPLVIIKWVKKESTTKISIDILRNHYREKITNSFRILTISALSKLENYYPKHNDWIKSSIGINSMDHWTKKKYIEYLKNIYILCAGATVNSYIQLNIILCEQKARTHIYPKRIFFFQYFLFGYLDTKFIDIFFFFLCSIIFPSIYRQKKRSLTLLYKIKCL